MLLNEQLKLKGRYHVEVERAGKIINAFDIENRVVDVGANKLLDIGFYTAIKIATWYIGLVSSAGFSAFADTDTMSSHAGWTEFVGYSGGVRPTWVPNAPGARAISNTALAAFTISAPGTIKGGFVSSDGTLGGTIGTLWSEAAFPALQPVLMGDLVRVIYSLSVA